jgi:hypothetical protein
MIDRNSLTIAGFWWIIVTRRGHPQGDAPTGGFVNLTEYDADRCVFVYPPNDFAD